MNDIFIVMCSFDIFYLVISYLLFINFTSILWLFLGFSAAKTVDVNPLIVVTPEACKITF